jgi:hypothetical protein
MASAINSIPLAPARAGLERELTWGMAALRNHHHPAWLFSYIRIERPEPGARSAAEPDGIIAQRSEDRRE